ncbi:ABC transporter substrate-binding protein [Cupriavidus taiwanensis]|uniref:PERIPLASMIC DIPEPTIDE TRANSPORT PROTEIN n=1 Tax=Cupriavidus taiwanensis TaxID=164546 RepID=A0A7Z7NNM9_9BURK|nr:ABC transporter substrate-binding protein [Cupriavidus taiwanensis]SOY89427.1 PERIPLASMIC DIPEPTIDE TRANSPORT PROTEIN [Cupriavidus taiwanensis]SOZ03347.1 PERIPLASMIC DIPEPTIDE TRANSPORT PROTEIN [Cupriavidus taiwanensis]SOZ06626.1 PERIPLASMIC DIPEPTIDE TRANSPORT PROTEIN [Cupriavidus taiwanensis]SPC20146.1 PERIPLASMIC DIPEPTIDE TRANSPORT PROTEIN [Cupriavidus taiwanensis]SPD41816.1 Peptide/nickel transport system substrate-binding protein [Cupriavidus taiwanensis]
MSLRTFKKAIGAVAVAGALGLALAGTAQAADLKLAMSSPPTSMDPHFYNLFSNINVSEHIFDSLTKMDPDSRIIPGLAESWKLVNNLTWEFKIRKGVKFHDGTELTAEDVIWSLDRPATIQNSPGKFDVYTKAIVNKKIIDKHTIQLTTSQPYPLMLNDLTSIFIVQKKATQGLGSDDFAQGKGMIGTGPFKFVSYARDDRVELVRNNDYWGNKPAWDKVTLRFIPNPATRLAALLSGDVQAIENVPTPDLPKVRNDPKLAFFSKISHRVIYLYFDAKRDKSPYVTTKEGAPLDKNPLKDTRVRNAISMAINRQGIKDRLMEGLSEPTNNLVPPTLFGYNPNLKTVKYDPEGAKKLLAEAGFPNGFGVTLHTPNNRYVNDEKIAQTIAQNLTRIGIATKVEGMPMATYSSKGIKHEWSFGLLGWGAQTGEVSSPLRALLACEDSKKGFGTTNWGEYCNPKMDVVLEKALSTVDDTERSKLLQEATAIAINDGGIIPIHQQVTTWATQKGIVYVPRTDERTYAHNFKPQ